MFRELARNTAFSGVAYVGVAVLNLVIVPMIVRAHGLTGYGLIVLARVLLPTGFMAVFDFGVSETSTVVVARARASGDWSKASRQVSLLLWIAIAAGLLMAGILLVAAPTLAHWFRVGVDSREPFVHVIRVTGLALPLLFPALVVEGVIKGFERYGVLRLLEFLAALSYVLGTIWVIRQGYSFAAVAYVFVATQMLKHLALIACSSGVLQHVRPTFAMPEAEARADVWRRSLLMLQGKVLGAVQAQAQVPLIGLLVGPAGVGTYDVLTRMPRAAKSVFSLLNAALLPVSARLDESGNRPGLRALGRAGFWLLPALTFPALVGAAVFAREFLLNWVGADLAAYWPWLALMFAVPLLNTILGFGQTLMQVRSTFLAQSNRLTALQIALQIGLSLALVPLFAERGFIAGQVAAMVAFFPFHLRLLLKEQDLEPAAMWRLLSRHALVAVPLAAGAILLKQEAFAEGWGWLVAGFSVWCAVYWVCAYTVTLTTDDRIRVRKIIVSALGR